MKIIPNLTDLAGLRKALSSRVAQAQTGMYTGTDAKARNAHPGAVPVASPDELDAARVKGVDLRGRVKPFDRYGRRRVFDVAHHTAPNRAERRARAKSMRGLRMAPGHNKPLERGGAR